MQYTCSLVLAKQGQAGRCEPGASVAGPHRPTRHRTTQGPPYPRHPNHRYPHPQGDRRIINYYAAARLDGLDRCEDFEVSGARESARACGLMSLPWGGRG
jgi:hypothetical protein